MHLKVGKSFNHLFNDKASEVTRILRNNSSRQTIYNSSLHMVIDAHQIFIQNTT
jgi:hypothetical protein